jgi:Ca2+-binding RTX toxin-like protein
MAVFYSDLGFNFNAVDFHAPLVGNHSYTADGATQFSVPDITLSALGASLTIPGFDVTVQGQLTVNFGRDSSQVVMGDGLQFDRGGAITAGTAQVILAQNSAGIEFAFAGFAGSAPDFSAAVHTVGRADDRAYLMQVLAGNDLVALSKSDDVFNSGAGRDLVVDAGGNDSIHSGAGNDIVVAGKGDDTVQAGLGADVVLGGAGNDSLGGGAGRDILWAAAGTDTVSGGAGPDAFLFALGDGTATITDFEQGDLIHYIGPPGSLINLQIQQDGDDTKITFSGLTVILQGFDRDNLDADAIVQDGTAALTAAVEAFLTGWDYT